MAKAITPMAQTSIAGDVSLPGLKDLLVIILNSSYLGRHVRNRSGVDLVLAVCIAHAGDAEVDDLDLHLAGGLEEDVLELEVPMNDAPDVAVVHCVDYLEDDPARLGLRDSAPLLHPLVELAACRALHDHDQLLALHEGVVQLDDVLVLQLF